MHNAHHINYMSFSTTNACCAFDILCYRVKALCTDSMFFGYYDLEGTHVANLPTKPSLGEGTLFT